MSVISGTRRAMKEMADGTLRVQIDIDPRFRATFFEMFGQIDMPVALAPLVADFERKEPETEKPKGGELAKLAGMWCATTDFREWMRKEHGYYVTDAEGAAEWVRSVCGVGSRAALDNDAQAADKFQLAIRLPYMAWMRGDRSWRSQNPPVHET